MTEFVFDFNTSLKDGHSNEELFNLLNPSLTRTDGFQYDFEYKGQSIELKSDNYSMGKTPNFCFEVYSDKERKTLGGPLQSQSKGVKYFIYFFVQDKKWFIFDVDQLCERMKKLHKENRTEPNGVRYDNIPNKGWWTYVFLVPRELVQDIVLDMRFE